MVKKQAKTSLNESEMSLLKQNYDQLVERSTCYICNNRMKKVACIECGHTFCRPCITKHLAKTPQCPKCLSNCSKEKVIINKSITLFYEHLQNILIQCERNLPAEAKSKVPIEKMASITPTPSTSAQRTTRRSMTAGKTGDGAPQMSNPSTGSTNIFELIKPSTTRMPTQFPNESSVISQYSINPDEKVQFWLEQTKSGAIPTQDKTIETPSSISTLISPTQADLNEIARFKPPPTIPKKATSGETTQVEESQADSILMARNVKKITFEANKSIESEPTRDAELFQSQSEEFQSKKEEKRLKKIDSQSSEKPKFKGFGLRKKKILPIKYDSEEEKEPSQPPATVELADFLDSAEKRKPSRQYNNKKKQAKDIENGAGESPQEQSLLQSEEVLEPVGIIEDSSPQGSPTKKKTPSPGFSRYSRMKSEFKEKRKIVPLNISTTSGLNAVQTEKSQKKSPDRNEMIIETASEKSDQKTADEQKDDTQTSTNLIENSLPPIIERPVEVPTLTTPTFIRPSDKSDQKTADEQKDDTQASTNLIENSLPPIISLQALEKPVEVPTPTFIRPAPEPISLDSKTGNRKRKTFSLESNTGDIVGNSLTSQRQHVVEILPIKKKTTAKSRLVCFHRFGKLKGHSTRKYEVNFFKLGYLNPLVVRQKLKFARKQVCDAAVQTSPLHMSQAETFPADGTLITKENQGQSVLCQTSFSPIRQVLESSTQSNDQGSGEQKSQLCEEMDEDIIEKSQESVVHTFLRPAAVQESCQIDSNDIIPASMPTPSQPLKRQMDSSSLSLSPPTPGQSFETLMSLNESEYELQNTEVGNAKRRKVRQARKKSSTPKKVTWSDLENTQDAAVMNVAMEDLKYAREKATEADKTIELPSSISYETELKIGGDKALMDKSVNSAKSDSKTAKKPVRNLSFDMDVQYIELDNNVAKNSHTEKTVVESGKNLVCKESDDEGEEVDAIEGTPIVKVVTAPREEKETPPRSGISLIFTSLGRNQIAEIQKFCKSFKNCSVNTAMNSSVTHLVVPHSEDMNTLTTLKFYLAVAKGLWVVSINWIVDCISSGKIIPEEPYEMKNMHGCDGPRRSRLRKGAIFAELEMFCLDGTYSGITKEQVKEIIVCAGGSLLQNLQAPQTKKYRIVISPSENLSDEPFDGSFLVLMVDWVLESIENCRLASAFNYLPSGITVTQVSQSQFQLPADMLRFESSDTLN
ncbi:uncharacterized protein LOC132199129 [Neocloeon triangulifer]|uniref:uncharacterized protein LOC132199129 n=1 Tax=Neocloeon triangulifer TaxID=2078957 RepID=UPI00286F4100|nr:uncharacterized protein LOC132199129 [Neocloeon triangulifer]